MIKIIRHYSEFEWDEYLIIIYYSKYGKGTSGDWEVSPPADRLQLQRKVIATICSNDHPVTVTPRAQHNELLIVGSTSKRI